MKKLLALILSLLLAFGCLACDAQNTPIPQNPTPAPSYHDSPEDIAKEFMRALAYLDMDALVDCLPEYNVNFMLASARQTGLEADENLTDRQALAQLLKDELSEERDSAVTEATFTATKIDEDNYPGDLMAELYEVVEEEGAPEGIDPTLLDQVDEVAWVEIAGTVTYEDGTTEEDTITVPCVKIDDKWYVDMFSMLFLAAF